MDNYKFSLIMATCGRRQEVKQFIESLLMQDYSNYELIVVDQNEDDYIKKLCEEYKNSINIIYVHSSKKGLSLARNIGLKYATGNTIAFPDDDCEYSKGLLKNVINEFDKNDVDIVTFKSIDKFNNADSNTKWHKYNTNITYNNIFTTAISYTIFIKTKKIEDIKFDENLGVGAYYGSSEETDMLLNLLHNKYTGIYIKDLYAYHPIKPEIEERYYKYALGMGALLKKEIIYRKNFRYINEALKYIFIRPIGGAIINLFKLKLGNIRKYLSIFRGRIKGFIKYSQVIT